MRSDQPVLDAQDLFGTRTGQSGRRQPVQLRLDIQVCRCIVKRRVGREMRLILQLEISDMYRVTHVASPSCEIIHRALPC